MTKIYLKTKPAVFQFCRVLSLSNASGSVFISKHKSIFDHFFSIKNESLLSNIIIILFHRETMVLLTIVLTLSCQSQLLSSAFVRLLMSYCSLYNKQYRLDRTAPKREVR